MAEKNAVSRDTDDIKTAWKRAQEGDPGALVDWAQYGLGYLVGQAGETLGVAAIGALAGIPPDTSWAPSPQPWPYPAPQPTAWQAPTSSSTPSTNFAKPEAATSPSRRKPTPTTSSSPVFLGIGAPVFKSLAASALGKAGAATAALGTDLATETLTQIEQKAADLEAQQYAQGQPITAEPDWSPSGISQAAREVTPQTLALNGIMGGAAIGGKAVHSTLTPRPSANTGANPFGQQRVRRPMRTIQGNAAETPWNAKLSSVLCTEKAVE